MLSDEALAGVVRATGWSLDWVFLGAYLLSTLLVWSGLTLIGARVYRHAWTTMALVAAFTLRHRITRTSANSLEPYFHPRMLAFGLGLLALAALLRRRDRAGRGARGGRRGRARDHGTLVRPADWRGHRDPRIAGGGPPLLPLHGPWRWPWRAWALADRTAARPAR